MKTFIFAMLLALLLNRVFTNEDKNVKFSLLELIKIFNPLPPVPISWKTTSLQSKQILAKYLSRKRVGERVKPYEWRIPKRIKILDFLWHVINVQQKVNSV